MARNAFDLLRAGKPATKRRRESTAPTSKLVQCPVCSRHVHELLLNDHIDRDCGRKKARSGADERPKPATSKKDAAAAAAGTAAVGDGTAGEDTGDSVAAAAPRAAPTASPPPSVPSQSGDALAVLMKSARSGSRREVFFLELAPDPGARTARFRWTWRPVPLEEWQAKWSQANPHSAGKGGSDAAAWSAVTKAKPVRGGPAYRVGLATNVPSHDHFPRADELEALSRALPPTACALAVGKLSDGDDAHSRPPPSGPPPLDADAYALPPAATKSALQKCVRLGRVRPAVRVAWAMMRRSFSDFVRRVTIIMVEDTMLHPCAPLAVWAMIAHSKGYLPPPSMVLALLAMTGELAGCRWQDPLPDSHTGDERPPSEEEVDGMEDESAAALVRSLLSRSRFGGMHGDMAMLRGYARLWYERFQSDAERASASASVPAGGVDGSGHGVDHGSASVDVCLALPWQGQQQQQQQQQQRKGSGTPQRSGAAEASGACPVDHDGFSTASEAVRRGQLWREGAGAAMSPRAGAAAAAAVRPRPYVPGLQYTADDGRVRTEPCWMRLIIGLFIPHGLACGSMGRDGTPARPVRGGWSLIDLIVGGGPLTDGDVPPSALDFHCSSVVEDVQGRERAAWERAEACTREAMARAGAGSSLPPAQVSVETAERVKTAMWWFKSSLNVRRRALREACYAEADATERCKKEATRAVWGCVVEACERLQRGQLRWRFRQSRQAVAGGGGK